MVLFNEEGIYSQHMWRNERRSNTFTVVRAYLILKNIKHKSKLVYEDERFIYDSIVESLTVRKMSEKIICVGIVVSLTIKSLLKLRCNHKDLY